MIKSETESETASLIKSVKLSKTTYTYNGKVQKPNVIVKSTAGKILTKGTDYSVSYSKGCKNPGIYTVNITFKGDYFTIAKKSLTYTIKPKAVSVSKLIAKTKGLKATWKKGTSVTGYEIQYSTNSKFTKKTTKTVTVKSAKTTSKNITKLSAKKKYYVRVRTYKTVKVNGKSTKIYSNWSKTKSLTTKK